MSRPITLALTGDVMLGRKVDEALARFGPLYPWGDMLPLLKGADLTVVNLECVIAQGGCPWSRWPKAFHFRTLPTAITSLEQAGVDCVTLANNHVLDYEEEAFREMLGHLEQAGIAFTGAGRDLDEARRPAMLEAHGFRLAIVAFTDNEPGWAAGPSSPGTNYIPITLEPRSLEPVRRAISDARGAGADFVVFSIHWGPNMVERPTPLFRRFAHAVIEAGADLFFGHSAHVFQGIELYRDTPIIYDAGDFVDDYVVDPVLRNDWGLFFQVNSELGRATRIDLAPVMIAHRQVNRADETVHRAIARRITALSAELGTRVHQEGSRLWVPCPSGNGRAAGMPPETDSQPNPSALPA